MQRYEQSLNPQQQEYLQNIKSLEGKQLDLSDQIHGLRRMAKYMLMCDIPINMADKEFAHAIADAVLQSAFDRQRHFLRDRVVIHSQKADNKFGLMLQSGNAASIDLDAVQHLLDEGAYVDQQLSSPDNWRRVNTPRGIGYAIERDTKDLGMAFKAANLLMRIPKYAGQCPTCLSGRWRGDEWR